MKKVVNRILYDTDTSELLHTFYSEDVILEPNGQNLYKTRNGDLFLVGDGESVCPLTKDQALDWLEQHGGTEAILRYFPDDIKQ